MPAAYPRGHCGPQIGPSRSSCGGHKKPRVTSVNVEPSTFVYSASSPAIHRKPCSGNDARDDVGIS